MPQAPVAALTATPTEIPEVLVLEPRVIGDERGFFMEAWNARSFEEATGLRREFVQDNHSRSAGGVLRGIHYQVGQAQAKLLRVVRGAVWDLAVDLRRSSPMFGRWVAADLSEENHRQLWIPEGFGHAFLVLTETADVLYKATEFYIQQHDRSLAWDDPDLAIDWPLDGAEPILSVKDASAPRLAAAELFP